MRRLALTRSLRSLRSAELIVLPPSGTAGPASAVLHKAGIRHGPPPAARAAAGEFRPVMPDRWHLEPRL